VREKAKELQTNATTSLYEGPLDRNPVGAMKEFIYGRMMQLVSSAHLYPL